MARMNAKGRRGSRELRVVAKGYRKVRRDIERLQHASLDYFNADLERQAQEERSRQLERPTEVAAPEASQPTGDDDAKR